MKRRTTKKPRPATARITRRRSLSRAPKMVASHQSSPSSPPPGGPRRSRRAAGLFGNVPGRYSTSANEFGRFGGDFGDFGGDAREGTRDAALPGGGGRLGGGTSRRMRMPRRPGFERRGVRGVRNALGGPGSVSVSLARGVAAWWTPGRSGPRLRRRRASSRPAPGGARGACRQPGGAASRASRRWGAAAARRRRAAGSVPAGSRGPSAEAGRTARRRARREPRLRRRATRAGRGRFLQHHRRALSLREEPRLPRGIRRRGPARRPRSLVVASRDARTSTSAASIAAIRTPRASDAVRRARARRRGASNGRARLPPATVSKTFRPARAATTSSRAAGKHASTAVGYSPATQ